MHKLFFPGVLLLFCLATRLQAQQASCPSNIDFEQGTLSSWNCFTGINYANTPTNWASGPPVAGRHTITTGTGLDNLGAFPVVAPGGGLYSLKLGNEQGGANTEKVSYTLTVPPAAGSYTLYFRYAVVLQNPTHTPAEQPFFKIVVFDLTDGRVVPCDSNMFISSGTLPGFIETSRNSGIWYKDWSAGTLKLDGLAGHVINIDFTSADCTQGGHFGYGYVDMNCGSYAIIAANCNGAATTPLTGPPGFQTYTWYDDNYTTILGSTQTITVPTPTSGSPVYHVVLNPYPGYGCIDTLSTQIKFSTLTVDATPDSTNLCALSSVQLNTAQTGSAPPFSYSWTPISGLSCAACPNPVANPGTNMVYTVAVTDNNGCTINDSVRVIARLQAATSVTNVTCTTVQDGSATVTPSGGIPPYTYSWNTTPVRTTQTINGLAAGTYTVTVIDAAGCMVTALVTVGVATPAVNSTKQDVSCFGLSNGVATITSIFGTAPNTYSWNTTPAQTGPSATNLPAGSYTVTITEAGGCTTTKLIVITQPAQLVATATLTDALCAGIPNGALSLAATGGALPYRYAWNTSPVTNGANAINLAAGTYTGTVTDNNGCTATVTRTVSTRSTIQHNVSVVNRSCPGGSSSELLASASGGTGTLHYQWNTTPVRTTPRISGIPAGTYIVTVTDSLGCAVRDTVALTDYTPPVITASPDQDLCLGEQVPLTVQGAVSYAWSPPAGLSCSTCPNPVAAPTVQTTYQVIGKDGNGCTDTAFVTVKVIVRVPVSVDTGTRICLGEQVRLGATGGEAYAWSPAGSLDGPFLANPLARPDQTTTYQVIITENRCFKDTLTQTVTVLPLPAIDIGHGFTGIPGATVQLHPVVQGAQTIRWAPPQGLSCTDCLEPVVTLDKNIIYLAEVTDSNGCKAADTLRIDVSCGADAFYMANTFTPNSDGRNDYFYPQAFAVNKVARFMVYNRWGEVVFAATDMPVNVPERGWNGTYKGKELSPDVFVYVVEAICADGTPVVVRGDIALVR